ncbi:N-acetylglucosamine kinase [Mucilaginibacter terrae]|uniref:Glucosamine kinase n=1 Tax=Mucilaginibacter terrae TaxID=1955052 RepID=A0ABU3GTX3_9SPHI|nr:N-acetylglucosamine kinase [Mucilaginibacter terrae]MDT3403234.1 glucosamine kinase [Mucilaginibacter terrae]
MIIVADSGSSKTDWVLASDKQESVKFSTAGLNPFFLSEKEIIKIIQEQAPVMVNHFPLIEEIYFFGAGCSSPDKREVVSNALSHIFPRAFVSVDSDLLGSAYATCGTHKGLVCVLGTGSNISFFDGEDVTTGKHGLGYVLGDEGSGTWFGKNLITDYMYGRMPADVNAKFCTEFNLTKDDIITNVYLKRGANSYLASFARFLSEVKTTEYGKQLIKRGLQEFIDTDIKSYAQYQEYTCHFVGSIAYFFTNELKELCAENGISAGKIIRHPIDGLVDFILSRSHIRA